MKLTTFGLAALTVALFTLAPPPAPRSAPPINSIVGDASYLATYGRAPEAATDEDLRIRTHLKYVLRELRAAPAPAASPDLREARALNLARLERYIAIGEFPRNPAGTHGRKPNFLDASGRICAVGYLVREDLGRRAVETINARYQFARIFDMGSEALASWQATSGLTLRELAMIQPEYCDDGLPCGRVFDDVVAQDEGPSAAHVALGVGNVALGAFNVASTGGSERRTLLALGGIGLGAAGLILSSDEEASVPVFNAAAGLFSLFAGTIQLIKPREAKASSAEAPSGLSQVRVGPVLRDGERLLAVQVRF